MRSCLSLAWLVLVLVLGCGVSLASGQLSVTTTTPTLFVPRTSTTTVLSFDLSIAIVDADRPTMTITCLYGRAEWCPGQQLPVTISPSSLYVPYIPPTTGAGQELCQATITTSTTVLTPSASTFPFGGTAQVDIGDLSTTVPTTITLEYAVPNGETLHVMVSCDLGFTQQVDFTGSTLSSTFQYSTGQSNQRDRCNFALTSANSIDLRYTILDPIREIILGTPSIPFVLADKPTTQPAGSQRTITVTPMMSATAGLPQLTVTLTCSRSGTQSVGTWSPADFASTTATDRVKRFRYRAPECGSVDTCVFRLTCDSSPCLNVAAFPTWAPVTITPATSARANWRLQVSNLKQTATREARVELHTGCFTPNAIVQVQRSSRVELLNLDWYELAIKKTNIDSSIACTKESSDQSSCIFEFGSIRLGSIQRGDGILSVAADGTVDLGPAVLYHDGVTPVTTAWTTIRFQQEDGTKGEMKLTSDHLLFRRTPSSADSLIAHPFVYSATGPMDAFGEQGGLSLSRAVPARSIAVQDELYLQPLPAGGATSTSPAAALTTVRVLSVVTRSLTEIPLSVRGRSFRPIVDGLVASTTVDSIRSIWSYLQYASKFKANWITHRDFGNALTKYTFDDPVIFAVLFSKTVPLADKLALFEEKLALAQADYN